MLRYLAAFVLATALLGAASAADAPLKVLLITGGCCHDYKTQKDIIKSGLESRVNCVVEQIHVDVDKTNATKPPFPHHGNPEYAKGFDLVIHDECAAAIQDPAIIDAVLKPHLVDGLPAINLHCAMHSYRFGDIGKPVTAGADNAKWFLYLGLQTTGHGPQEPINIVFVDKEHPITKGLSDWMTIKEELYNNIAIHGGLPLARGKQMVKGKEVETVVAWTNEVGPKKAKVFSTTIGHNNDTVADPRYLDMVARAVLWTTGHINADGTAAAGYGKK